MAHKKIKSATDQRPFVMVYHDFLESDILTVYEKMVFIALKKFANGNAQCFPSLNKLADITRISKRKVQDTLKSLEKKHIISIESRSREDGGDTSNLYILHDFKELWKAGSSEEAAAVIDKIEEQRMIEALTAKGYYISKEKGLETEPTKAQLQAPQNYNSDVNKNTTTGTKSQVERYSLEDLKILYDYDSLIIQHPEKRTDIDTMIYILYDALNSTKEVIRIGGEDKPAMVVISKLMKLQPDDLIYSIKRYHQQASRIKNVKAYLLTILYHAKEQAYLDLMNEGHFRGDF